MGKPAADLTSAASTHSLHSLRNVSDDLALDQPSSLPPSYEQVTAESSGSFSSDNARIGLSSEGNRYARPVLHLHEVVVGIPGGRGAVSVWSSVRDSTIVTLQPELSNHAHELHVAIAQQIRIPPRPLISVVGTHTDSRKKTQDKKSGSEVVTDFSFCVDLTETLLTGWDHLNGDPSLPWYTVEISRDADGIRTYRGTRLKTTAWKPRKQTSGSLRLGQIQLTDEDPGNDASVSIGDEEEEEEEEEEEHRLVQPDITHEQALHESLYAFFGSKQDRDDLMEWCQRFCDDPSPVKSFTLKRRIRNFNYQTVINSFKSHIRDINYRGSITVCPVLSNGAITVYSPHWINKLRNHSAVYWLFIITQLWIIAWPVIWLLERRYEVVECSWYASHALEENGHIVSRKYACGRDEHALGEFWAPAVKQAAWTCRVDREVVSLEDAERLQGLTTEQLLRGFSSDTAAEAERRQRMQRGEGTFLDSVVGLARGVSEIRQDWNRAMGWGGNV